MLLEAPSPSVKIDLVGNSAQKRELSYLHLEFLLHGRHSGMATSIHVTDWRAMFQVAAVPVPHGGVDSLSTWKPSGCVITACISSSRALVSRNAPKSSSAYRASF